MYVGIVKHKDKIISLYTSREQHKIIEHFKEKVHKFNMETGGYECSGHDNLYGRLLKLNIYMSSYIK